MKTRINSKVENKGLIESTTTCHLIAPNRKLSSPKDRKRSIENDICHVNSNKRTRTIQNLGDEKYQEESDAFCWICHCEGCGVSCDLCPRFYHVKCLIKAPPTGQWICPECQKIMAAEAVETKSKVLQLISIDTLCILLRYVLQRMKLPETKPFHLPVDCSSLPTYTDFVFYPMDFATIDKNIEKQIYGSTEAFTADVKWILHNCIVFNGKNHPLTSVAKSMFKICCHESSELRICPDCYLNSCIKEDDDWFCEPCRTPHTLVWAKMKGYPFWPAKVLREENNQIDVRFFGEHDRAWVAISQVYLLSENPPGAVPKKTKGFDFAKTELKRHLELLSQQTFSNFTYAPDKTFYKLSMDSRREFLGGEISSSSSDQIPSTCGVITKTSNKLMLKRKLLHNQPKHFSSKRVFLRSTDVKERRTSGRRQQTIVGGEDANTEVNKDSTKIVLKINKLHLMQNSPSNCEKISDVKIFEMENHGLVNQNEEFSCGENMEILEDSNEIENGDDCRETNHSVDSVRHVIDESLDIGQMNNKDVDVKCISSKVDESACSDAISNVMNSFDNKINHFIRERTHENAHILSQNHGATEAIQTTVEENDLNINNKEFHEILQNNQSFPTIELVGQENNHSDSGCMDTFVNRTEVDDGLSEVVQDTTVMNLGADENIYKSVFDVVVIEPDQCNDTPDSQISSFHINSNKTSFSKNIPHGDCIENDKNNRLTEFEPCSHLLTSPKVNRKSLTSASLPTASIKDAEGDDDVNIYVGKMLSGIKNVLSDFVEDFLSPNQPNIFQNFMKEEFRKIKESYNAELNSLKHSTALQIAEMRLLYQYEKNKLENTKTREILAVKTKLWCVNCLKEAIYSCCWKASYCSAQCQKEHWFNHADTCSHSQELCNDYSATKTFHPFKKPDKKVKSKLQNPVIRTILNAQSVQRSRQDISTPQHSNYLLRQASPYQDHQQKVVSQHLHHHQYAARGTSSNILGSVCGYMAPLKQQVIAPLPKLPPN